MFLALLSTAGVVSAQQVMRSGPFQMSLQPGADNAQCVSTTANPGSTGVHARTATCLPVGLDQMWRFDPHSDGTHRIVNLRSGGCLDVEWGSTADGGRILDWPCNGQRNQRWHVRFSDLGSVVWAMIQSAQSHHCLDVSGGSVVQRTCDPTNYGAPMWWLLAGDNRSPKGVGVGLTVVRGGLCASNNNRWTYLAGCGDDQRDRFRMLPRSDYSEDFTIATNEGKCLATEPYPDGYTYVGVHSCNAGNAQSWRLVPSGDAWLVRNVATGTCLNAQHGTSHAGTWLIAWPCSPASDNARWRLRMPWQS